MPNIAVVNYCNLKCKYCFADDMIAEDSRTITIEDYIKILEWCSRTPNNHIGIIGGEPTLHPHFDRILQETNKYCREVNTDATLFTNGINLEKFLPYIGERIHLLINCNTPNDQSTESFKKTQQTLNHLYELSWFDAKASCGCNLFPGCDDYSYIWDIVDRYHLQHIRCSVVSPCACYESMRADKELYYNKMKPVFLDFCKDAEKHHCRLGMDCGHIPMCYFDKEETELVESVCDNLYQDFCNPVIDITSDYRATSCFGTYDASVDIRDFPTTVELERYLLLEKVYPLAKANNDGKCATCKKHELLQCQGGCLGFAKAGERG